MFNQESFQNKMMRAFVEKLNQSEDNVGKSYLMSLVENGYDPLLSFQARAAEQKDTFEFTDIELALYERAVKKMAPVRLLETTTRLPDVSEERKKNKKRRTKDVLQIAGVSAVIGIAGAIPMAIGMNMTPESQISHTERLGREQRLKQVPAEQKEIEGAIKLFTEEKLDELRQKYEEKAKKLQEESEKLREGLYVDSPDASLPLVGLGTLLISLSMGVLLMGSGAILLDWRKELKDLKNENTSEKKSLPEIDMDMTALTRNMTSFLHERYEAQMAKRRDNTRKLT